jgi:hypothetical protein
MALWINREIEDRDFTPLLEMQVGALLLGYAPPDRKQHLTTVLANASRALKHSDLVS